jgi:glycosyltransferase involved in cell wall biosynthesis
MRETVLISSGVGRLHFIDLASALVKNENRSFELVCGYVPQEKDSFVLNIIGRWLGRPRLYDRLVVRLGRGGDLKPFLRSNGLAEGIAQLALRIASFGIISRSQGQLWAWKFFGWRTCRYINKQKIFHVRSGAGGGGAIEKARSLGMAIVVDHSIAHPAFIDALLAPEYARVGEEFEGGPNTPFWRLVLRDCALADVILVNSDFVKKTFIEYGFSADKIAVIYWGVPSDFIGLKQHYTRQLKIRLLFTGALELRKGSRCLVEAMEYLQRMNFDFELHLAGNSSDGRRHFGDRLSCLPIVDHGPLLQPELKKLIEESDLYIFPTLAEGCARSAMEAMFAGLPVVTTEACGLPGKPNEHYRLIEPNDSRSLAESIVALAENEAERRRMGSTGIALATTGGYTWEAFGASLSSLYGNLNIPSGITPQWEKVY